MALPRKWLVNSVFGSLLTGIFGLLLLVYPMFTTKVVCFVCGGLVILLGFGRIFDYLRSDPFYNARSDLPTAAMLIALGLLIILKVDLVVSLTPAALATVIIYSGLVKLQKLLDCVRMGQPILWIVVLVLAVIAFGYGVFLLIDPFGWKTVNAVEFPCLGGGLLFSALSDLFVTLFIMPRAKRLAREDLADGSDDEKEDAEK